MKNVAVIANPFAGTGKNRLHGNDAVKLLKEKGFHASLLATTGVGHATELARASAGEFDLVVAVGGDGTVHETAAGLVGTDCPFGVLPSGSGNDFARGIGCPDVASGLEVITAGRISSFDTGKMDGRFFVNSVGLLASGLVSLRASRLWRWLGRRRYLVASLNTILNYRGDDVGWVISQGSETIEIHDRFLLVEICNGPFTGGGFRFAPDADFTDGLLEGCLIRPVGPVAGIKLLGPAARGDRLDHPAISLVQGTRISFKVSRPVGYHLDGEPGMLPAGEHVIEIEPGSLNVLAR